MVWSHDALQTSSLSHHRTEDTASLCPDNVIRGVWVGAKTYKHHILHLNLLMCSSVFVLWGHRDHSPWWGPAVESSVSFSVCRQALQPRPPHLWELTAQERMWLVRDLLSIQTSLRCDQFFWQPTCWPNLQHFVPRATAELCGSNKNAFTDKEKLWKPLSCPSLTNVVVFLDPQTHFYCIPLYLWAGGICGNSINAPCVTSAAVSGFHLVPLRVPLPQQDGLVQRGRQEQRGETVCRGITKQLF